MKVLIADIPDHTQNYEAALLSCHVPFQVSLSPEEAALCQRLLLPGGGDIHPSWFGQKRNGAFPGNPWLDRAQLSILDSFVQAGKPVLGICRGLQLINVYFGGNLIQDLPAASGHSHAKKDLHHPVSNVSGSVLHKLYGDFCIVNSAHHQSCGRTGHGLTITQTTPDGIIEGLEHTEKPVLGVQWHPERTGFSFQTPGIADGEIMIQYFLTQM